MSGETNKPTFERWTFIFMIVLTHPDEGVACGGQNILVAVTFESVRPTGHLWRAGHNRPKPKQVFCGGFLQIMPLLDSMTGLDLDEARKALPCLISFLLP